MNEPESARCPLCGGEFPAREACAPGCPLGSRCNTLCCPHCGYRFVDERRSAFARVVARLLPRRGA